MLASHSSSRCSGSWQLQRALHNLAPCRIQGVRARNSATVFASSKPLVVLTREKGKNDKLAAELAARHMEYVELPLIEHTDGEDRARLPDMLKDPQYDWVAVTSPEAATVFLQAWNEAGQPQVRMAVVGSGTGEVLKAAGLTPTFTPSKAYGKTMGGELPHIQGGTDRVLYPSSAKAGSDLYDSLTAAGFHVTRLHTYNTVGVKHVPEDQLAVAKAARIMTYGSPSAVKSWVALVGKEHADSQASVCIGSTSARACELLGLTKIYYPDAPGIDTWAECVEQAAKDLGLLKQ